MKKITALLIALLMVLSCTTALAAKEAGGPPRTQVDTSSWEDADIEGAGLELKYPSDLTVAADPAAEDETCVWSASSDQIEVSVSIVSLEETTIDAISDELTGEGYTVAANALSEAGVKFDHLLVTTSENPFELGVVFAGLDGCFYEFSMVAFSEEAANVFSGLISNLELGE